MKKYALFFLLAAFVIACGGKEETASSAGNSQASVASASVDGEKIYKQYCVTCHGIYGDMGASGAFNLKTSQLTVDERIQVITNGRNAMTPFKTLLNEEKIKAVAEYTMTLKDSGEVGGGD